ncbi:uncharacterized protein LOC142491849 [Ascaphus truei]|uniref:uncharacterized protein LOC142491849 n=1 Tax=Ascaphus truei TaxID=8439 RepID=UPI003F59729E
MEQVSSPGSASSTLLEEHHGDEDDEYDEDDATEETEIQSCDHEEVPIETVVPPNRPSTSTYDAIVASEGKIVDAENRRHSDMMTVLERMIGLQEETVSQLAHLHRVFIEVPKQLQKINTSFEALVVQQTQANYWRMTNVPQFNTSQPGSVHAGQFSPHSSDIHSPGPNVTGQVADIAVQVPDDILPLPSVQIQQQTPTKEATKTKQDTHETDQPSLVQCLPTCSHVSLGTSPVREQSLPKSPVGESLPKSPVGESLPKSPVGKKPPSNEKSFDIKTTINNFDLKTCRSEGIYSTTRDLGKLFNSKAAEIEESKARHDFSTHQPFQRVMDISIKAYYAYFFLLTRGIFKSEVLYIILKNIFQNSSSCFEGQDVFPLVLLP